MKLILLFSFVSLSSFPLLSRDIKWPEYVKAEIPEQYKKEKAIYLNYTQTYNFGDYGESFYTNFQRIYMNSTEAIDEYANRELELETDVSISILAGRVIKKSGEIIELDKSKIIISNVTSGKKNSEELYRKATLIYPNVEIGDVLDLMYDIDFDGYVYSETMYLARELPILYSSITLRNNTIWDLTAYPLNGLPQLVSEKDKLGPFFKTEQTNVSAIYDGSFNTIHPLFPKLIFNLWPPGEKLNYDVYYNWKYRTQYNDYSTFGSFTEDLKKNKILTAEELQEPFKAFVKVHKHLVETMEWDENINMTNADKLNGYFAQKKINGHIFMELLENFMIENKMDYFDCRTQNRWAGTFETAVVALDQLRARFFMVNDANGNGHYIFPPNLVSKRIYFLDEIPFAYEGNSAIAISGVEGVLKQIQRINIPECNENETQQNVNIQLNISAIAPFNISGNRQDKFSGHYSLIARSKMEDEIKENLKFSSKPIEVSKLASAFPYEAEFRQTWEDSVCISELDESLKMLDLSSFLPANVFSENEKDENYKDYVLLPFKKQQNFRFFIQSEVPIHLEEKQELKRVVNSVGECSYNLEQMNETSFKIVCKVVIKKRILETEEDYKNFEELIRFYHEMKEKKWVFSL